MELIATARFKRAIDRATEAEAYTRKIAELAADLSATRDRRHASAAAEARAGQERSLLLVHLLQPRPVRRLQRRHPPRGQRADPPARGGGRRAAPGAVRQAGRSPTSATSGITGRADLHPVRGQAALRRGGGAGRIATSREFIAGKIDRVEVAYMKFLNAARQMPVVETLLPLSNAAPETRGAARQRRSRTPVEYEFLPGPDDILEELLPVSFKVRLFKCFLDAAVSEQIARRVTMKAATENADDMIKSLTRQYNRARQAQITKEIAEVIGGAAALE